MLIFNIKNINQEIENKKRADHNNLPFTPLKYNI